LERLREGGRRREGVHGGGSIVSAVAKRLYVIAVVIAVSALILSLSMVAPVLSTATDFSIYNTGWNGTSSLAISAYHSGKLTPTFGLSSTGSDMEVTHTPLTSFNLDPLKSALIVIGPTLDFSDAEGQIVGDFVRGGGKLFLADDFGTGNSLLQGMNATSRFSGYLLMDLAFDKQPQFPLCFDLNSKSNITGRISTLLFNFPSSIVTGSGTQTLARSSVASFLDTNGNHLRDWTETFDSYPLIALESMGNGSILLVSDPSLLINGMLNQSDNQIFANNTMAFLSQGREGIFFDESHRDYFDPVTVSMTTIGGLPDLMKAIIIAFVIFICVAILTDVPRRAFRWMANGLLWIWHFILGLIFRKKRKEIQKRKLTDEELLRAVMGRHPEWRPGLLRMLLEQAEYHGRTKGW